MMAARRDELRAERDELRPGDPVEAGVVLPRVVPKTDYELARDRFHVSASEVRRELGTEMLLRIELGVSDTKLIEVVMAAMYRVTQWETPHTRPKGTE